MNFAWSSGELHQLCRSQHGLAVAAPAQADDVKLLLTLLARADNFAQLDQLSCVTIDRTGNMAVLRLGAVAISVTEVGPAASSRERLLGPESRSGLKIEQIRVDGQPLLRAAG